MPMSTQQKTPATEPFVPELLQPQWYNLHAHGPHVIPQNLQYAQQEHAPPPQHHLVWAIIYDATGELLDYLQLIKHHEYKIIWQQAPANELGHLVQEIRDLTGTDTIKFIQKHTVSTGHTPMCGQIVVDYWPQKMEPHKVTLHWAVTILTIQGDVSTPMADVTATKLLFNSTISTPQAQFFTLDIKIFYLYMPLDRPKFMHMCSDIMPAEIIDK